MKPLRLIKENQIEAELSLCADCCSSELETCDHENKQPVLVIGRGFYLASECELFDQPCEYCNCTRCKCDDWKTSEDR